MDFLCFFIILTFVSIKGISGAQNYFSIKLINEAFVNEEYTRQVKNANGDVYLITAIKR